MAVRASACSESPDRLIFPTDHQPVISSLFPCPPVFTKAKSSAFSNMNSTSTSSPPTSPFRPPNSSTRRATRAASSSQLAISPPQTSHLCSSPPTSVTTLNIKLGATSHTSPTHPKRSAKASPTGSTPGKHRRTSSSSPRSSGLSPSVESTTTDPGFPRVGWFANRAATGDEVADNGHDYFARVRDQIDGYRRRADQAEEQLSATADELGAARKARARSEEGQAQAKVEQVKAEGERDKAKADAKEAKDETPKARKEAAKAIEDRKAVLLEATELKANLQSATERLAEREEGHKT